MLNYTLLTSPLTALISLCWVFVGVASVTYGDGFELTGGSVALRVNATGDRFATQRVQQCLQAKGDYLQTRVIDSYDRHATLQASPWQNLSIIAQRLPALAERASDACDLCHRIIDIDLLTVEQSQPFSWFDDVGVTFSSNSLKHQVDLTALLQRSNFNQALVISAFACAAIDTLWDIETTRVQQAIAALSMLQQAANTGKLVAEHGLNSDASPPATLSFNPIGLDFGGVLATTALNTSAVQFDVLGTADMDAHKTTRMKKSCCRRKKAKCQVLSTMKSVAAQATVAKTCRVNKAEILVFLTHNR